MSTDEEKIAIRERLGEPGVRAADDVTPNGGMPAVTTGRPHDWDVEIEATQIKLKPRLASAARPARSEAAAPPAAPAARADRLSARPAARPRRGEVVEFRRADRLHEILSALCRTCRGVEGATVVTIDGLVMSSVLPSTSDEDVAGAMAVALTGLGERVARELRRAAMEQVMVRTSRGCVLVHAVNDEACLLVVVGDEAKLGMVLLDVKRTITQIGKCL